MKKIISIIGVGLIGGSIGMSLKKTKKFKIIGIGRHPEKLKLAKKLNAIDEYTDDFEYGVKNSHFIIISTPVNIISDIYKKILPYLKKDAIVTDVGSIKFPIIKNILNTKNPEFFIGSHPLTGSEKQGIEFANPDIFKNAVVVITPLNNDFTKINKLKKLWELTHADVLIMSAKQHDKLVSFISHLPHILSACLVNFVANKNKKYLQLKKLVAGSFRDMTRISDSDVENWVDICNLNKNFLKKAIDEYIKLVSRIDLNSINSLKKVFYNAKINRKKILERND